ncbi:hypothetical protein DEO72_LG8g2595 [Vigna unguiculata]|uniref:Uncharacterized protein n=1 Tax=Vigna unguiculata TaxID=3917 RepID=A0A4D6MWP7_VIGUN|nr:hypothetical protein DEO72_LG8g2595 [Vigna unguiculata]
MRRSLGGNVSQPGTRHTPEPMFHGYCPAATTHRQVLLALRISLTPLSPADLSHAARCYTINMLATALASNQLDVFKNSVICIRLTIYRSIFDNLTQGYN